LGGFLYHLKYKNKNYMYKIFLFFKSIPEAGLGVLLALVAAVQPPVVRDWDDLLAAGRASGGGLRG